MTMYNVRLELNQKQVDEDLVVRLHEQLHAYHATVGTSPRGWLSVRLSLPAESTLQAVSSAIAVVERLAGAHTIVSEAMTEDEFAAREGFVPVPDLISTTQFADLMGISRARVGQMIDEGKLTTAKKVGGTTVITLSEAIAKARAAGRPEDAYTAALGADWTG